MEVLHTLELGQSFGISWGQGLEQAPEFGLDMFLCLDYQRIFQESISPGHRSLTLPARGPKWGIINAVAAVA